MRYYVTVRAHGSVAARFEVRPSVKALGELLGFVDVRGITVELRWVDPEADNDPFGLMAELA